MIAGNQPGRSSLFPRVSSPYCLRNPRAVTAAATIYEAYTLWAEANDETSPSKQGAFGRALSERGVDRKRLNSGWVRPGIALRPDEQVRS